MQCPHCGKTSQKESGICEHCGKRLNEPPGAKAEPGKGGISGDKKQPTKGPSEPTATPAQKSKLTLLVLIPALLIAALIVYYLLRSRTPPPKLGTTYNVPSSAEVFFTTLRERIVEVGEAKSYYRIAQSIMGAEAVPVPMISPSPAPTDFSQQAKYLKALENYTRALERFKHAKQVVADIRGDEGYEDCQKAFVDAVTNYLAASEMMKNLANDLYEGKSDSSKATILAEAKVKYEMGEKLMTEFLMSGCKGTYFKYLNKRDTERVLVLKAYQQFFAEKFEAQRPTIELLIQSGAVPPPPESPPNP